MKTALLKNAPFAIITAALLVSAPRLASAFAFIEPSFMSLPVEVVTGPAFGILTASATIYTWHVYQERKKLKLARWLLVGWIGLVTLIAVILVPGMVAEIRSVSLDAVLPAPLDVAWCSLVAISSELVIGLTALAVAISEPAAKRERKVTTEAVAKSAQAVVRAKDERKPCRWCGRSMSQNGLNAHQYRCKMKPDA